MTPIDFTMSFVALAFPAFAQVSWSSLSNTNAPQPYCGFAWDSAHGRLVAFGGKSGATPVDTTSQWRGQVFGWQTVTPTPRPSPRSRPAMAFDAARGESVLFGGETLAGANGETWTWDGNTWTQHATAIAPPARFGSAMAYDSKRQVVVLFGGFVPSGSDISDVWEWDGSTWTQRTFAQPAPAPRGAHRLAYDQARGETLLYGGFSTSAATTIADCWAWNGTAWSAKPATPGSLSDQVFAYDMGRQRVVLWGGLNIAGTTSTDLTQSWEWNGTAWTQRTPPSVPPGRSSAAHGWDHENNRVLVAGGITATGQTLLDTRAYGPTDPGQAGPFSPTGCPSSAGPIQLVTDSYPHIGLPFVQRLTGAPASAVVGVIMFGESNFAWQGTQLPISLAGFGAPGCELLVSLDSSILVPLLNGTGTMVWNLPNLPPAIAYMFFTQGLILDPQSALSLPIAMSEGLLCLVGAP